MIIRKIFCFLDFKFFLHSFPSGCIFLNFKLKLFYLHLNVFERLLIFKNPKALTKLFTNLIKVLGAFTLHGFDLTDHNLSVPLSFIDVGVEALVHDLFWLTKPSEKIWMLFHLLFVIFKIEVIFAAGKLLKDFTNILFIQRDRISKRSRPHLSKGLDNFSEVVKVNLTLFLFIQQLETLFHFLFFRSMKHDIEITKILLKSNVITFSFIHDTEHAVT